MSIWSRLWGDSVPEQLDQIFDQLTKIKRRLDQMGTDIRALDDKLEQLSGAVGELRTAVEALIAALPPGDFTQEIQQVTDAFDNVQQVTAEAKGATPPSA